MNTCSNTSRKNEIHSTFEHRFVLTGFCYRMQHKDFQDPLTYPLSEGLVNLPKPLHNVLPRQSGQLQRERERERVHSLVVPVCSDCMWGSLSEQIKKRQNTNKRLCQRLSTWMGSKQLMEGH